MGPHGPLTLKLITALQRLCAWVFVFVCCCCLFGLVWSTKRLLKSKPFLLVEGWRKGRSPGCCQYYLVFPVTRKRWLLLLHKASPVREEGDRETLPDCNPSGQLGEENGGFCKSSSEPPLWPSFHPSFIFPISNLQKLL